MHFSSASVAYLETSYISFNDCFAAMQIVMVTKRLLRHLSVLLSYWVLPFIVQFCGFEIILTLYALEYTRLNFSISAMSLE